MAALKTYSLFDRGVGMRCGFFVDVNTIDPVDDDHELPRRIDALPEMEFLLRAGWQMIHGKDCDGFDHSTCKQRWNEARQALLDRIDRGDT